MKQYDLLCVRLRVSKTECNKIVTCDSASDVNLFYSKEC